MRSAGQHTYNSSNQLLSTSVVSFAFDYNGNTTSKTNTNGTTTYTWDYENRLTSVTLPGTGGTVTFKYDSFGRRIQKSGPLGTMNFLYDGSNVVADVDTSGAFLARYVQGAGIDEPLSMNATTGTSFFEADGLGSITSLSSIGGLTDSYSCKPFGNTTVTGTTSNRFRYTGREWDQETGLYYYRARYYDPQIGFISEDPIRFRAGTNFYLYVRNNPLNFRDPSGREGVGVLVDGTTGAVYGALGALSQNGDVLDIIAGGAIGFTIGAGIGIADLSGGILSNGASAVAGNLAGQMITNWHHNKCVSNPRNYNWWEVAGAGAGGALGAWSSQGINCGAQKLRRDIACG